MLFFSHSPKCTKIGVKKKFYDTFNNIIKFINLWSFVKLVSVNNVKEKN